MFFAQAVPLAAGIENNRELAGLVVRRVTRERPTEQLVSELAAAIEALEEAFRHAVPAAADELLFALWPLARAVGGPRAGLARRHRPRDRCPIGGRAG